VSVDVCAVGARFLMARDSGNYPPKIPVEKSQMRYCKRVDKLTSVDRVGKKEFRKSNREMVEMGSCGTVQRAMHLIS
jgi:hypothetical protein